MLLLDLLPARISYFNSLLSHLALGAVACEQQEAISNCSPTPHCSAVRPPPIYGCIREMLFLEPKLRLHPCYKQALQLVLKAADSATAPLWVVSQLSCSQVLLMKLLLVLVCVSQACMPL